MLLAFACVTGFPAGANEAFGAQAQPEPAQVLRVGDPHAHGIKDEDLEAMRAILRKAVEDKTVPGVSLLLAHRGEIIFREAFGNITVDQKVMMASSSKPVTATVVMILADRKKLSLDDPIEKYLPEFKGDHDQGQAAQKPADRTSFALQYVGLAGRFPLGITLETGQEWRRPKTRTRPRKKANAGFGLMSRRNRSLPESVRASGRGRSGNRARRGISLLLDGLQRRGESR